MPIWFPWPLLQSALLKPKKWIAKDSWLPALGLDVVHVQVLALADRLHHFADVDAVLDHRVAHLVIAQRQLVAHRNVALRGDLEVLVVLHDPALERLAGLDAFHHDDADAVAFLVDNEMNHGALFYSHVYPPPVPPERWRPCSFVAGTGADLSVRSRRRLRLSVADRHRAVDAAPRRAR